MADEIEIPVLAPCDENACVVEIDINQVNKIYESMSSLVYADMDKQYKENKISGTTYAETYAKLMDSVVSGALQAVVAIQNKETDADRCVKQAQCELSEKQKLLIEEQIDASEAKTANENKVATENVASSQTKTANETCIATSTCSLNASKQKAEDIKNGDAADGTSLYGYNKDVLQKQSELYVRQKLGFDDNARQKLLETQMSAWSIVWKEGSVITIPCGVTKEGIDTSLDNVNNNIGEETPSIGDITPPCE